MCTLCPHTQIKVTSMRTVTLPPPTPSLHPRPTRQCQPHANACKSGGGSIDPLVAARSSITEFRRAWLPLLSASYLDAYMTNRSLSQVSCMHCVPPLSCSQAKGGRLQDVALACLLCHCWFVSGACVAPTTCCILSWGHVSRPSFLPASHLECLLGQRCRNHWGLLIITPTIYIGICL